MAGERITKGDQAAIFYFIDEPLSTSPLFVREHFLKVLIKLNEFATREHELSDAEILEQSDKLGVFDPSCLHPAQRPYAGDDLANDPIEDRYGVYRLSPRWQWPHSAEVYCVGLVGKRLARSSLTSRTEADING